MYTVRVTAYNGRKFNKTNHLVKDLDDVNRCLKGIGEDYVVVEAHIMAQLDKKELEEEFDVKET